MSNSKASFGIIYTLTILLALAFGFFAGVELNPKPIKVIVEKTIEEQIVEKRVPVEVVVEKKINSLPNFIRSRGQELDCYDYSKQPLILPRSKWNPIEKDEADPKDSWRISRLMEREAMFNVAKFMLITKIRCRLELNQNEFELLTELVNTEETEVMKIKAGDF